MDISVPPSVVREEEVVAAVIDHEEDVLVSEIKKGGEEEVQFEEIILLEEKREESQDSGHFLEKDIVEVDKSAGQKDLKNGENNEEEEEEEEEEDEEIYEVDSILQERTRRGVKEYFVRWKGYGPEYDTWEPEDNLNCDDIIEEFKRQKALKRGRPGRKRKIAQEEEKQDGREEDKEATPSPPPVKKSRRGRPKQSGSQQKVNKNKRGTTGQGRRRGRQPKEPPLVIKCKTIFKKHLIQNCIKCEDRRDPDDDNSPDAIVKYFMRYDIDSGQFFVGDVRVDVDEEKKCIKCSACEKVFGDLTIEQRLIPGKTPLQFWQMVRDMKLHIIGRHLGGFTCYLCDEPYGFHTRGASHYYRHMGDFHRADRQTEQEDKRKEQGGVGDNNDEDSETN